MQLQELEFHSTAGAWRLWLWQPSPDLAPAVTGLWATEAQTVAFRERVLPRESVELMLNLGGPQTLERTDRPGSLQLFHHAWVSGLQSACLEISSPTPARLVAASLHPAHAGAIVGLEGSEIANEVVPLDHLLSSETGPLVERMHACPTVTARFQLMEAFLRHRIARARKTNPAAFYGIQRILASGGQVAARALREELNCSARYLEKQLASHTGLTPKQLARLVRFSRAVEQIRTDPAPDWSRVAQSCGFYDQPHFNNEFRQFTGTTPGEFLLLRDPSSQAMLVD